MARSSTTYTAKWRKGKTTVIRVPDALANEVLSYARELDIKNALAREPEAAYRTAFDVSLTNPVNVAAVPQRSLFRYPGGKTWLVPYIRTWLSSLKPKPTVLIEPFAGGGIVGLTAGFENLANHVVLVEKDPDVSSVWKTVLGGQAEWLAHRIETFRLTKTSATTVLGESVVSQRERAFATILRNRVQRGGIMAPGAGLVKTGENGRGITSRWYPETLARRIREIAAMRHRFTFVEGDGMAAIDGYSDDESTAFYVDPPYTVAARRLYCHWQLDHRDLFSRLKRVNGSVLMTYDHTPDILGLATEFGFDSDTITMKNTHHTHMTELLVSQDLTWLHDAQVSSRLNSQTPQGILAPLR